MAMVKYKRCANCGCKFIPKQQTHKKVCSDECFKYKKRKIQKKNRMIHRHSNYRYNVLRFWFSKQPNKEELDWEIDKCIIRLNVLKELMEKRGEDFEEKIFRKTQETDEKIGEITETNEKRLQRVG